MKKVHHGIEHLKGVQKSQYEGTEFHIQKVKVLQLTQKEKCSEASPLHQLFSLTGITGDQYVLEHDPGM